MPFTIPSLNIVVFFALSGGFSLPVVYSVLNYKKDTTTRWFREYNLGENEKTIKQISDFPLIKNHSDIDLIKGDSNYNDGNYVMYFGSEFCPYCNFLLYTEQTKHVDDDEENRALLLKNSTWHQSYTYGKDGGKLGTKLKFIMYSDSFKTENTEHQVLPWTTHTEDNQVNSGKIKGDFIRYDESAVNFRKIKDQLSAYLGIEKTQTIPKVIFYKDGRPLVLNSDKFKEIEDRNNIWNLLNKDKPKDQKTPRVTNELSEFMTYYYKLKHEPM